MIRPLLIVLACLLTVPVRAAPQGACGPHYDQEITLDLDAGDRPLADHLTGQGVVLKQGGLMNTHIWKQAGRPVLTVTYPKDSINPGHPSAPAGGGGFFWPGFGTKGVERACLRYRVRFEPGFDFNRGGKLPGLYGTFGGTVKTKASGCRRATDGKEFSARLMWRRGGAGEVYAYTANRPGECGWSLGQGNWYFRPGTWTEVAQEIILNRPGQANGAVRLWIDGILVVDRNGLIYRDTPQTTIRGLFFSTFFGGHDESWASPRTQSARFSDFRLFAPD